MKKIVVASVIGMILLLGTTAVAAADWAFVLSTSDGGNTYQVKYVSDGEDLVTDAYTLYIGDNPNTNVTVVHHLPSGMAEMGSGDKGNGKIVITAVNLLGESTISNGYVLADLTSDAPTNLTWLPDEYSFKVYIYEPLPEGEYNGRQLYDGGHLGVEGGTPPIPEIATAVLMGTSLLAFAGWIWAKRIKAREVIAS
jgi:hypothetical protein